MSTAIAKQTKKAASGAIYQPLFNFKTCVFWVYTTFHSLTCISTP